MDNIQELMLEPAKAYSECFKEKFSELNNELFDKLLRESGVDAEENRKVAAEYRKAQNSALEFGKRLSKMKGLRVFLIILSILAVLLLVFGIADQNVLLSVISGVVAVAGFAVCFSVLKKKIAALKTEFDTFSDTSRRLYERAMETVSPLLTKFDSGMVTELIEKTVPTLNFDKNFNMRRYDCLNGKYGYGEDDGDEASTVGILSGEIIGNPFVFERSLRHRWGTQTYHGAKTIHWTTFSTDSKGNRITQHHTQTLHATVTKPKPFFSTFTRLVYGNEAAPDLSFSRTATYADDMSERKLKSFVRSNSKKIKKLAKKRMAAGFTELGNEEFDAIFGATDRDHEVQFRLLFTPLAQKNLLGIMKGESPFGDDFGFVKTKCINYIASDHAQNWRFNIDASDYYSYDVDLCRQKFMNVNSAYFESVYFDFAPLLSIPLYQQIKPKEYIYKESYSRNITTREAEVMANRLGSNVLSHPKSVTPAILKTTLIERMGKTDKLSVHALSYRTVRRIAYVPVYGGDGNYHDVVVPWLLYIPLERETVLNLSELGMTDTEFRHSEYNNDTHPQAFYHSILASLGEIEREEDSSPDETDDLSEAGIGIDEG